jgi:hypothetical protein
MTGQILGKPNSQAMAISGENDSMRITSTVTALMFTILIAAVLMPIQPATAAKPYCPNPAHAKPGKVPTELMGAVARIFQIDNDSARNVAFVRCVGPKLMGCYIGANLDCYKADKSRTLPGATAWCRENPGSKIIPMSATGHDTIYEWSCNGRRAVAGPAMMTVDSQGYIAENWKEIR